MIDTILKILTEFDIRLDVGDPFVNFIVESTTTEILNLCNLTELPEELEHIVIRRALGQILHFKFTTDADNMNIEAGLNSISEGDVSLSFDKSLDPGKMMAKYIAESKDYGVNELNSFRKFRW